MDLTREDILGNLRRKIAARKAIIGGGAGSGLSARCEEAGGIDLIGVYNSGKYRMAGRGSLGGMLAYGNANSIVLELGRQVLPVVKHVPVLAGINCTDPFVNWDNFLRQLQDEGFAGVQNSPTVGLIDGNFRANLEETGMGYAEEVEVMARAHDHGLFTAPSVFSPEDAIAMSKAGADMIVAHMGLTMMGSMGAQTAKSMEDCIVLIDAIAEAARSVRSDIIIMCHGGPIAQPEDVHCVLTRCRQLHGYFGGSSLERLPAEQAVKKHVAGFMELSY